MHIRLSKAEVREALWEYVNRHTAGIALVEVRLPNRWGVPVVICRDRDIPVPGKP